jgi:hypothetical protein
MGQSFFIQESKFFFDPFSSCLDGAKVLKINGLIRDGTGDQWLRNIDHFDS